METGLTGSADSLLPPPRINRLVAVSRTGHTLVPLRLYFKNGIAKVELALAKGKRLHDKRDALARKDAERRIERVLKEYR